MKCPDCGHINIQGADNCDACGIDLSAVSKPPKGMTKVILEATMKDLKPRDAITVAQSESVSTVVKMMREKKMGCVLIVDKDEIIGIMTERDLLFGVAGVKQPEEAELESLMHKNPVCLQEDDPLSYAFHHMSVGGFRHLPIKRGDGTVGIVSARDLLRFLTATH